MTKNTPLQINKDYKEFLQEIKSKIKTSRMQASLAVNQEIIKLVVSNLCEKRKIHFKLSGEDVEKYFEWLTLLRQQYGHPPISIWNSGCNIGSKIDGKYENCNEFIYIHNHTRRDKEAREALSYKVYGGKIDESKVSLHIFYELMARVMHGGLSLNEDLDLTAQGKYGSQDQIYVKTVSLGKEALPECALEMKEAILSTLERVTQPYVAVVLGLEKSAPYTIQELYWEKVSFPKILLNFSLDRV